MKSSVKRFLSTLCVLTSVSGVFTPTLVNASSTHEEYGRDFSSEVTSDEDAFDFEEGPVLAEEKVLPDGTVKKVFTNGIIQYLNKDGSGYYEADNSDTEESPYLPPCYSSSYVVPTVYKGKNPYGKIWIETIRSAMNYEGRGKGFFDRAVWDMRLGGLSRENMVKIIMLAHFYDLLASNEYVDRFKDCIVNDSEIKEAVIKKFLETEENKETGMKEFLEFIEKEFCTQIERMKTACEQLGSEKDKEKEYWVKAFRVWYALKERILKGEDSTGFRWSHDGLVKSIFLTYELDWMLE